MNSTTLKSLTALFKAIKEEQPSQFAVISEMDEAGKVQYIYSRPFVGEQVKGEDKQ